MCSLIDYPDGTTVDSIRSLSERYPNSRRVGVVTLDGGRFLYLHEALRQFGDQCLCSADVEAVLAEAGEKWAETDFGYEVRPQESRYSDDPVMDRAKNQRTSRYGAD